MSLKELIILAEVVVTKTLVTLKRVLFSLQILKEWDTTMAAMLNQKSTI